MSERILCDLDVDDVRISRFDVPRKAKSTNLTTLSFLVGRILYHYNFYDAHSFCCIALEMFNASIGCLVNELLLALPLLLNPLIRLHGSWHD